MHKERLGLQPGILHEQHFESWPDVGESVGLGTPVSVHVRDLAGQPLEAAVLACGLGIHPRLGGGEFLGNTEEIELPELADLQIGDHEEPPCGRVPLGVRLLADREF
jgi:hypothetical protein